MNKLECLLWAADHTLPSALVFLLCDPGELPEVMINKLVGGGIADA